MEAAMMDNAVHLLSGFVLHKGKDQMTRLTGWSVLMGHSCIFVYFI